VKPKRHIDCCLAPSCTMMRMCCYC